jgi:hypothetical protein
MNEPETIVAPTHFAEAFVRVRHGPDGSAAWEPVG